jgi:hypothetical protein
MTMSENTGNVENTEQSVTPENLQPVDKKSAQGALASWETPHMSFQERMQKHGRQMVTRLYGPAGSVVFHIVAIAILVTFAATKGNVVMESDPVVIEAPKAPELDKTEVKPEKIEQQNNEEVSDTPDSLGVSDQVTTEPIGGSGTQPEGIGLGTGDPNLADKGFEISTTVKSRLVMKGLYSSRTAGGRAGALGKWGHGGAGAKATELAVLRALRWLKKNQNDNGTWTGSKMNVPPAMTGMALLTYLAHGETPQSREFGATVKKALDWMVENQSGDGNFKGADGNNYSQPIGTYALCEAYGMTQHPSLKDPAIKAVTAVVKGQHGSGGFGYKLALDERNDSSYMGWCCQSLKSAKMAGLEPDVPGLEQAIKHAIEGFKQNALNTGGFGYTGPAASGLSGAGALSMQLLGAPQAMEVKNTLKYLDGCTFSFADWQKQPYGGSSPFYYWYYITQAKFQFSEDTFKQWNKIFSPELCKQQIIEPNAIADADGKMQDIGHWESPSHGEHTGGLVQDTCLCAMMLEVYYRFLPSFQHSEALPDDVAAVKKTDDKDVAIKVK